MTNAAPAIISTTDGRRDMPEIAIGNCAASAISNPFGGRTRGLFNASSFMFVSLKCRPNFTKRFCGSLHPACIDASSDLFQQSLIDSPNLFPQGLAFVCQSEQYRTGIVWVRQLFDPAPIFETVQRLVYVLAA